MLLRQVNEKHARCAARILRFTSTCAVLKEECISISDLSSRLIYGERIDYSLLLSAQDEVIRLGGSYALFDDIRKDFVH